MNKNYDIDLNEDIDKLPPKKVKDKNMKWYVLIVVVLLVVSNAATFLFSNMISIAVGSKVIVQAKDAHDAAFLSKMLYLKDEIQTNYYKDVKEKDLLDGALEGMFDAVGDPYTSYFDEAQFASYLEQVEGTYVGIGVVVTMSEDKRVTVVSPIDGSPGKKAGLVSGDIILKIDDKEIEGKTLEQVVAMIKGDAGTSVILTVQKKSNNEVINKTIIREEIVVKSIQSEVYNGNIGVITINQFESNTYDEFITALDGLLAQNVKGIVFDVRGNPGGMMDIVVKMLDRLMGKSIIVYTQDKNGNKEYENSDEANKIDLPMAVLINSGSASASEIFAGALQDTKEATIVGTTSFGKGIVQRMTDMNDGTGYKITVSEYFTPNGRNIHGKGIVPDVVVPMEEEALSAEGYSLAADPQFLKAVETLNIK
ncbi:MAG: S41 family peptidase [Eubacteriaceae bacterium]|nr:S41 family peptidase [Eubacteriaceae bacterium]